MKIVVVGAGIGGLGAALSLHAAGFRDIRLLDSAIELAPLGVGLNIQPNAVRELAALGLLGEVTAHAVATRELAFYNLFGQLIWREPRGTHAGNPWPQLAVHRGHLHKVLLNAATARLAPGSIITGTRATGMTHLPDDRVRLHLCSQTAERLWHLDADLVVGADGVHSALRHSLYPQESPPLWNGIAMWRGAAWVKPVLTGASMLVAGDDVNRVILYPIDQQTDGGRSLVNWVIARPGDDANGSATESDREELLRWIRRFWRCDWLDIDGIVRASPEILRHPMTDRDPLPRWSFGRVTLLGDAAHPMYPAGSNGATQAIIDGRVLARCLAAADDPSKELVEYENTRRAATSRIQLSNRGMGPESVISLVHQRAPGGFARITDVITESELMKVSSHYAGLTAADRDDRGDE